MLVLTRKPDQMIILGNGEITIKLLRVDGNKIRIGLDAPAHIPINRGEIFLQKIANQEIEGVYL